MNAKLLVLLGLLLCIFIVPLATEAVDLNFDIAISGQEISLVKGITDYTGVTNTSISQYERYIYSVDQSLFDYESTGFIGNNHDISVSTNLSGTRSGRSGIGGTDYIENVGVGNNKSYCVFGSRGIGHDLTVASVVTIQPTTLDYGYVIEARNGEAGAGYTKQTENVTTTSRYEIRGADVVVVGQQTYTRYPAVPAGKESLKKRLCPWGGDGEGFPIFIDKPAEEVATEYIKHYIITR